MHPIHFLGIRRQIGQLERSKTTKTSPFYLISSLGAVHSLVLGDWVFDNENELQFEKLRHV